MNTDSNDGKLMTKRIRASNRTTVNVSYSSDDAQALRRLAESITLKAGKRPSLSLLTRRSLQIYSDLMSDRASHGQEVCALNAMVTTAPTAPHTKKKAPA